MQFRLTGHGAALAHGLALRFEAEGPEAARASALRIFDAVPECEQIEISGGDCLMRLQAAAND